MNVTYTVCPTCTMNVKKRNSNSRWKTCSTLHKYLHYQGCQFIISLHRLQRRNDPRRCQAGVKQGHQVIRSHVTEMQWRNLARQPVQMSGMQGGEKIERIKEEEEEDLESFSEKSSLGLREVRRGLLAAHILHSERNWFLCPSKNCHLIVWGKKVRN